MGLQATCLVWHTLAIANNVARGLDKVTGFVSLLLEMLLSLFTQKSPDLEI